MLQGRGRGLDSGASTKSVRNGINGSKDGEGTSTRTGVRTTDAALTASCGSRRACAGAVVGVQEQGTGTIGGHLTLILWRVWLTAASGGDTFARDTHLC